jgi:hypothetical protein
MGRGIAISDVQELSVVPHAEETLRRTNTNRQLPNAPFTTVG